MKDIDRAMNALKYLSILSKHDIDKEGGVDKLMDDLMRILEALPIMIEHIDCNHADVLENDAEYDSLRLIANICQFVDAALPIINKYNPSDEDKARFVEYIKKMEENKDE